MDKSRKTYIDILRGLAVIGVVIIHVSANNWYGNVGSIDWIFFTIYEGICKSSVPVFFMISGCLFLNSAKNKVIKTIFVHHIFRLTIFCLFWAVTYKILLYYDSKTLLRPYIIKSLIELLKGDTQIHLWFIYAIIGLYILVPVIAPLIKYSSRRNLEYSIFICFIFGSACELLSQFSSFEIFTNNMNKIKSGISIGYTGYFLLGAYLDKYEIQKKSQNILYVLGLLGIISTVCMVCWDCISSHNLNERFWSYTMPNIYVSSLAIFLYIKNKTFHKNFFSKVLFELSKKSLGIYGAHVLVIMLLWRTGFNTYLFTGILSVPVISFIVLLLSYFLSAMLQKIPGVGQYIA